MLSEDFIVDAFLRVLDGLHEVHGRNVLHLDLKPTKDPAACATTTSIDFGAARRTVGSDSAFAIPMFTPGFAAPEACQRDGVVGAWSDVYGIGACMLACMSAKPPQEATARAREDLIPLALEILERS